MSGPPQMKKGGQNVTVGIGVGGMRGPFLGPRR
jgi:hypothetical protein